MVTVIDTRETECGVLNITISDNLWWPQKVVLWSLLHPSVRTWEMKAPL